MSAKYCVIIIIIIATDTSQTHDECFCVCVRASALSVVEPVRERMWDGRKRNERKLRYSDGSPANTKHPSTPRQFDIHFALNNRRYKRIMVTGAPCASSTSNSFRTCGTQVPNRAEPLQDSVRIENCLTCVPRETLAILNAVSDLSVLNFQMTTTLIF